jgi:hypothetical protein
MTSESFDRRVGHLIGGITSAGVSRPAKLKSRV